MLMQKGTCELHAYLDEGDSADKLRHHADPLVSRLEQILSDGDTALRDERVERYGDDEHDYTGKCCPAENAVRSAMLCSNFGIQLNK